MVLARKGRSAQLKLAAVEVPEMAHGWPAGGEGPGAGAIGPGAEPGVPRAMFLPHANSLPFEERCVSLEQPVKIGRNVYRAVPCPTNTIFECRVLSRHHATLWYEKGHFYIMDNQSSNGTFINNNRCSSSKEAEPHEVFSGDVLQFGIAVVENQTNQEKNTFLPVVALLKLYHPDGKEAKLTFNPAMTTPLHLKELYQLNNFLQEAMGREAALDSRLRTLRECVERTRAAALGGWQLLVGEQRLLARVHALEATIAAGKPLQHDTLERLLEDKHNYQEVAQESLRLAHEQRLALEEALEKKSREAHALHQHNCDLRLTTNHALAELQKLAARCERKMCAARLAIATAEEREAETRARLPLALSKMNGESRMLVVASDGSLRHPEEMQTLEDAVRSLPDYVKMMLPEHILNQIGIKMITIDGKNAKEFDVILKKNELNDLEIRGTKENRISLEDSVSDNCRELDTTTVASANDESNGCLNHVAESSERSPIVLERDMNSTHHPPDNNANSFHTLENHNETSMTKSQQDYSNWLVVVAGLKEEVSALRMRLADLSADNDKLRDVRDQLLSVKLEVQEELNERSMLELASAEDADGEKHDPESHKERVAELGARLERALAGERALAEELAVRPTARDHARLADTCRELRARLRERDHSDSASDRETVVDEASVLSELDAALDALDGEPDDAGEANSTQVNSSSDWEEDARDEFSNRDDDTLEESWRRDRDALGESSNQSGDALDESQIRQAEALMELQVRQEEALMDSQIFQEEPSEDSQIRQEAVMESQILQEEASEDSLIQQAEALMESQILQEEAFKESRIRQDEALDDSVEEKGASEEKSQEGEKEVVERALSERAAREASEAALLALQEELVRAKERWAEAAAECARLAAAWEGAVRGAGAGAGRALAVAVALLAAALYLLLYRQLS